MHKYNNKVCAYCNVTISYKNWSHHVKTKKHARLAPKTEIPKKKELYRMAKDLNMRGVSTLKKEELQRKIETLKKVRFNENELKTKTVKELRKLAKDNNIKVPYKYRKLQVIDAILHRENVLFKKEVASELSFSDDIFVPARKVKNQIEAIATAFKGRLKTFQINNSAGYKDISTFLNAVENIVIGKVRESLGKMNLKVNILLLAQYKRGISQNIEFHDANFKTENEVILSSTNLSEFYSQAKRKIIVETENFEARGSQWHLNQIYRLELRVNKYVPFRGSSYVELPKELAAKKAIINIKNDDDKCFLWSILAQLHPAPRDPQRVSKYKQYEHDFDEVLKEFPVKITDIDTFEKSTKISVNVFHYEIGSIRPLRITKQEEKDHINLLYLRDENKSHYCLIKNLWRLISNQVTKHCAHREVCVMCLSNFANKDLLNKHKIICSKNKPAEAQLPKPYDNKLCFSNWNNSLKVPFVIYADFESLLRKIHSCNPSGNKIDADGKVTETSYTKQYQKHEPISSCYYVKYQNEDYKAPVEHFGEDVAKQFYRSLREEAIKIAEIYENPVPMIPLNDEEKEKYEESKFCHICEKSIFEVPPILEKNVKLCVNAINYFLEIGDDEKYAEYKGKLEQLKHYAALNKRKVMDHDHLTGEYRGPAHSLCNINYRNPNFIPVFFHNLAGYDAHLFIKEFGNDDGHINMIPNTEEKYISFSKAVTYDGTKTINLRFVDSFKFLSSSLDTLAGNLNKDQFRELSKFIDKNHVDLVTKKLAYPYEYMDSEEKYEETNLPPIECFYSTLNNKNKDTMNDEEWEDFTKAYKNAQDIWTKFNVKNMTEFTQFYNKIDVLLLADIMENFRELSLETYKLDPVWYFTTPGFAWDAMLRKTEIELELLTDIDMLLMVESGIRGGITQCSKRYGKANNKYMNEKYDPSKESVYLGYFDANNEYGWSMCKYLPYKDFKWGCTEIDVTKISEEADTGYILEVDLEYPSELHDSHSDFPLAPENRIGSEQLPKLMTTLYNKKNYVVHYMNLKYYLQHGLKLTKIHRVLEFQQKSWLKTYIDLNTELRSKAKNDFEKDFYKLMNNSVFGKTMENLRNRVDIKLCSDERKAEKMIAKPNFKDRTLFTESLAAIHFEKTAITLNKPIYVGMSILETSKLCLYGFWYDVLKPKYGDQISLHYEDTDSQIFSVKTEDFYQDMKEFIDELDTSDYPQNNDYGIPRVNKKVLGKFKDELNGKILEEMIGLRSKCYALNTFENNKTKEKIRKIKGIQKCVVKNEIKFDDFKRCLFENETVYKKQNLFRSKLHDVYTIEMKKKALNNFDDKRFILENGIDTLAWGHYKIGIDQENFLDYLKDLNKTENN